MPRMRAEQRSPQQKEKYFISLYMRRGATEHEISYCERRACLTPGAGQIILRRKDVQEEITARMEPVRFAQMSQRLFSDEVARITAELQADRDRIKWELDTIMAVPDTNIHGELLEHALMRLMPGLDWESHPEVTLAAN